MCTFVTFLAHDYLRPYVFGKHSSNNCHLGVGGTCWMGTFELQRSFQRLKSHVHLCVPKWQGISYIHVKHLTHTLSSNREGKTNDYSMCETFANQ